MSRAQRPAWVDAGYRHIWMPYTQMQTAPPPEAVVATDGVRIRLADGRELIDGIASWWSACHGYNHPHIRAAVAAQLDAMPHVMLAGLSNEPAFTLAARLGTLFACEQAGIAPDIMTVSKSLTGGTVALAATIASERVFEAFQGDELERCLMHGPTFTGNALACAAANASLDLFEREPRLEQVRAIERTLGETLAPFRDIPGVSDVRVRGAIGVVELAGLGDMYWIRRRFIEEGCWLRPFGNIVYLMPAFTIEDHELRWLTDAIGRVLDEWSGRFGHGKSA